MRNRVSKTLFVLTASVLAMGSAYAQTRTVTGQVFDNFGDPVVGANVIIKGTNQGTMTDMEGNFSINVPANAVLQVTYIGFANQEVQTAGKSKFTISLSEDSQTLDDVVVVGYGVQRKADVTGATARVSSQELVAMPVKDALQGMQGKSAGVDITNSQRPGEVGNISIRGTRSLNADQGPLYVVDGMMLQNGGIENINPNDIESIDILKDASSTAIYGSRGANGVVLVTTKHGKEGKVSVNYAGTMTLEWMRDVTEYFSASEWLDYARMAKYNAGTYDSSIGTDGKVIPVYSIDKSLWGSVSASWANIEQAWVDGVYDASKVGEYDWASHGKQTGVSHDHNINVSGGNEKFQGYGSFGYLDQEGTQPGQEYNRYTMKASFDASPVKWFKMGTSINATYGLQDYGYSFTKSTTGAGDYYSALRAMLPWSVPYDENGDFIYSPTGDVNIINPIEELNYTVNRRKTFQANGNVYGNLDLGKMWSPLEGLTYRIQFGPEFRFYQTMTYNDENGINGDGNNKASWNKYNYQSWTLDNIINYNRTFNKVHKMGITLLQSAQDYHYDVMSGSASDVALNTELWYNLGSSTTNSVSSGLSEKSMISYMARANYSYADRYLFQASVRRDGASQLAEGHKWATFPAFSLGWRMEEENFMENTRDWLDQLKLRVGWGVSGNSAISPYATKGAIQGLYQQWGSDVVLGYVGSDASAKSPNSARNVELGWERTAQTNVGIDYGFLGNRISGAIDWYKTHSYDLLMKKSIPSITGYTTTYDNVGETSGWGVDFQINATPVKTRNFSWNVGLTWSLDRSEIEELANGKTEDVSNGWFVGEEIGIYYDYVYDGLWTTGRTTTLADGTEADASTYGRKTGQIKVKDLNGDGTIDADDKAIVGKVRPDWSGGITNTFNYKNWELSVFIYSRMGFDVKAGALTLDGRYMQRKIDYFVAGYNEDAEYYAPGINGESADTYQSSQNYQDGSYIKVRNINLGYTFTPKQLKKTGLSTLKIYAQCLNPFSIYRATDWLDTDLVSYANNSRNYGSSTTSTSFVLGLNIGF